MPRPERKPTFEKSYEPFVLERIPASKYKLDVKRAQVLEFEYDESNNDKHLIWVLTPKFNGQLHALSLKDIPWHQFRLILKKVTSDDSDMILERLKDLALPVDDMIERPQLFYDKVLKNHNAYQKYSPYRRFLFEKMRNINVVLMDLRTYVQYPEQYISPTGVIYEAIQKV